MFVLLLWYYGVWNRGLLSIFFCVTLPHMSIGAGVIVAIALQQVDDTPNGKTGTQGDNESLQNTNSGSKKCHKSIFAESKRCLRTDHNLAFSSPFKNCYLE